RLLGLASREAGPGPLVEQLHQPGQRPITRLLLLGKQLHGFAEVRLSFFRLARLQQHGAEVVQIGCVIVVKRVVAAGEVVKALLKSRGSLAELAVLPVEKAELVANANVVPAKLARLGLRA